MTPPDLRDWFETLRGLPLEQRESFMQREGIDATLRERLRRMLSAVQEHDPAAAELAVRPLAALHDALSAPVALPVGTRVGGFELLDVIGEGGFATVYRATRERDGVPQVVALKLLHRPLWSPQAQHQFRREHEVLARLRHPAIGRLIDAGIAPDGHAWLALELIDGLPITDFAQQRALDLRARMRLFVQVCRAVEAAHAALIVHRDLKPSNVLVTRDGRVQLIDFGIAKSIDGEDLTQTLAPGLTPAYAAPEQVRGEAVTTATDVYSLGVLLGELLTGVRPNSDPQRTPSALAAAHAGELAGQAARRLARQLRGDLDTLVMTAIDPDPARRYRSATLLAEDAEAWLAQRPLRAHPPSRLYRMRRFVARHRGAVATSFVMLLAVAAALGMALWQARVARSEAQRASEVQRFVEALFAPLQSGRNGDAAPSIAQLLQHGLARIEREPPQDPQVRAELLGFFARVSDGMGEIRSNVALSEHAAAAALEAWGPHDRRSLDAHTLLGRVLRKDGQYQRADEVLEAVRVQLEAQGIGGLTLAQVLDTQLNARLSYQRLAPDEVLRQRRAFLALREADPASGPEDLASGWNNLGNALEGVRDYRAAIEAYQRAFELRHRALGDSADAATTLGNVANAHSWMKQWQQALPVFEQARAMYGRAGIERHHGLAGLLNRLCDIRAVLEQHEQAAADCAASLAMNEALFGTAHIQYAWAVARDAGRLLAVGRLDAAGRRFDDARRVLDQAQGDTASVRPRIDIAEAGRWRLQEDYATLRDRLIPIADAPQYAEHWAAPLIFAWLALACEKAPAPDCGDQRRAAAEAVLKLPRFADDPLRLPARTALARIDAGRGAHAPAAHELQQELERVRELGPDHSWRAEAWLVLAQLHADAQARHEAAARAQAIRTRLPPDHPLWVASSNAAQR